MNNRREFMALLGGAAAAWPLAARAQQPGKLPTIGFLGASTRSAENEWIAAFVQRLRELGWIEGRTIAIEYRWSEGHDERLAEIAAEFVRRKVDVIVTWGTVPTIAAKQATSVIPIVFAAMGDPLGTGIVASLARRNVTGLSALVTDVAGKRLELLREVVPGLRRLAIMFNVDAPASVLDMRGVQQRRTRSASRSPRPKYSIQRISLLPSMRSKAMRTLFMSVLTRSCSPTWLASTFWRRPREYRRCMVAASTWRGEV
jgi:putative ABC transport system substrate-binding protein